MCVVEALPVGPQVPVAESVRAGLHAVLAVGNGKV